MNDYNIHLDNKAVNELGEALGGGGSDNTFIVNLTMPEQLPVGDVQLSQDKTNIEIYNAIQNGKLVFVKLVGTGDYLNKIFNGVILSAEYSEGEEENYYEFAVQSAMNNSESPYIYYSGSFYFGPDQGE